MPFAQVVEENGQKKLAPVPGGIAGGGVDAEARALAGQAKEIAEGALQKSGGTMTGPVSNLKIGGSLSASLFDASAISASWAKDNAPVKLPYPCTMFLGGSNASDTADLFEGRGFSEEMPFATLDGILKWVAANCVGYGITIRVLQDITVSAKVNVSVPNVSSIYLASEYTDMKTINLAAPISLSAGLLNIGNIQVVGQNPNTLFESSYAGFLTLANGLNISGSAGTVLTASSGGTILITDITSTITGKKYALSNGGRLLTFGKTEEQLPGTTAGTKDAASIIA